MGEDTRARNIEVSQRCLWGRAPESYAVIAWRKLDHSVILGLFAINGILRMHHAIHAPTRSVVHFNGSAGTFIDVFAGCGGLSLGLMRAGWRGLFAVEKDKFAFETLKANLLDSQDVHRFEWPSWLNQTPFCVMELLEQYGALLSGLEGKVDLLAGGPPCQGFSSAGRREASDPRNTLMRGYLQLVQKIKPKGVLVENVLGIAVDFVNEESDKKRINYANELIEELSVSYRVYWRSIDVSDFGVPQARTRFFLLGLRKDVQTGTADPFAILDQVRLPFLRSKGLVVPTNSQSAISDLEIGRNGTMDCCESPGFKSIAYIGPKTNYQRLMRAGYDNVAPSCTRLAKHRPEIVSRFAQIIELCHSNGRLNVSLSREIREAFGIKKQALRVLDPDNPSPTITSMPDDLLHYKEPRTLTVRENARLQSFPDWFEFRGNYTTGGERRKKEVPRFTQVANAVPPLMSEVLGLAIAKWMFQNA